MADTAVAMVANECRDRFERFGTAGHADKIKVIPQDDMARRYADGTL